MKVMSKKKQSSLIKYYNLLEKAGGTEFKVELKEEWLEHLAKHSMSTLEKLDAIAVEDDGVFNLVFERKGSFSVYEEQQKNGDVNIMQSELFDILRQLLDGKFKVNGKRPTEQEAMEMVLNPNHWMKIPDRLKDDVKALFAKSILVQNDSFALVNLIMLRICSDWEPVDTQHLNKELFDVLFKFAQEEQQGIDPEGKPEEVLPQPMTTVTEESEKLEKTQELTGIASTPT